MNKDDYNQKPIVLIGTGGAGKTTIGGLLAEGLGYNYMDSDEVIINNEQCAISEIFAQKGETYFRTLEKEAVKSLIEAKTPYLIGTGGGAFMNKETQALIKDKALSIFIKADIDVLKARVGDGVGRPLFDGKDVTQVLENLIAERYPIYEQADIIVDTYNEPLEETLARVTEALYNHLHNSGASA
jgi:shikimate kinase